MAQIVKTEYMIDLTINEMLSLLEKNQTKNLCASLRSIPGVDKVLYDVDFGSVIYITIENESENNLTWNRINTVVREFASTEIVFDSVDDELEFEEHIKSVLESSIPPAFDKEFLMWGGNGNLYEVVIRPLNVVVSTEAGV